MADLPRGGMPGVSSQGSLAGSSGSSKSDDSDDEGGSVWGKIGSVLPAAGGLLGAFFGQKSTDNVTPAITEVQGNARKLGAEGSELAQTGKDSLGPVLKYFQALASGDPSQALAATMPQRGRIIDQYDAARRSAGQFGPRGGGQASSQLEARTREASDLSNVTASARSEGMDKLATLGTSLTQTGLSAQESSNYQMASVLQPLLEQQKQHQENTGGFWKSIGEIAGAALMFL